jgi:hypothetical protein
MHMMEILTRRDQDNLLQLITDTTLAALRLSNAPELAAPQRRKKSPTRKVRAQTGANNSRSLGYESMKP